MTQKDTRKGRNFVWLALGAAGALILIALLYQPGGSPNVTPTVDERNSAMAEAAPAPDGQGLGA